MTLKILTRFLKFPLNVWYQLDKDLDPPEQFRTDSHFFFLAGGSSLITLERTQLRGF